MSRPVVLYIAMSLDGYIAGVDDNIDFLSLVETPGEDYGYSDFIQHVDTIIWGRRTYDKVLSFGIDFPHADKDVYVVSRSRTGQDRRVTYVEDVEVLISRLRQEAGGTIYCDGGGQLVKTLLDQHLIDRLIVSIIPHLLGDGIRLFADGRPSELLQLRRSTAFPSGLVQLWYDVQQPNDAA